MYFYLFNLKYPLTFHLSMHFTALKLAPPPVLDPRSAHIVFPVKNEPRQGAVPLHKERV